MDAHPLVHVNASLNTIATVLLVVAYVLVKQGREQSHRNAMIAALAVSAAFLGCYLYYHFAIQLTVKFTYPGPIRYVYYAILASHVLLAMTVPFLAFWAAFLGYQALREPKTDSETSAAAKARSGHRRIARWAFPIWLYVSVTGVLVYLMLYHWFPPLAA